MSNCISQIGICVTRGTLFTLDVGLSEQYVEVIANPSLYRAKLVFRAFQDDNSPALLTLVSTPELVTGPIILGPPVIIPFSAAGPVTQTLPDYDIVGYCDLYAAADPSNPVRLFNMEVEIGD